MGKKIKPITIETGITPPQTLEDKLEVIRNKINEIIEVINKCPQN